MGISRSDLMRALRGTVHQIPTRAKRGTGKRSTDKQRNLMFERMLAQHGIPVPEYEYRFCPERKWRFDAAWVGSKVFLEIDGGTWINGGHNRGSGYARDTEKRNAAAAMGWRGLRCEPSTLCTFETMTAIKNALFLDSQPTVKP